MEGRLFEARKHALFSIHSPSHSAWRNVYKTSRYNEIGFGRRADYGEEEYRIANNREGKGNVSYNVCATEIERLYLPLCTMSPASEWEEETEEGKGKEPL